MALFTSCRDPADNAPARPDWRTPSYCANLQAPRYTWVQLRTASLVEPTHHVSICTTCCSLSPLWDVPLLHLFPPPPPLFLFCSPVSLPLFFPLREIWGSLKSLTTVYLCSSFPPPDLESTIVCNCSNLTRAPTGNHGNSAPVCKNKN